MEYKKCIEPVQVLGFKGDRVQIINRYDHITLDHLECEVEVFGDVIHLILENATIPKGKCCI